MRLSNAGQAAEDKMLAFRQQHEPSPYDGIPTPGAHLPAKRLSAHDLQSLRSSGDSSAGSLSNESSTAEGGQDVPAQLHSRHDDSAARQSMEAKTAADDKRRHVSASALSHKEAALPPGTHPLVYHRQSTILSTS